MTRKFDIRISAEQLEMLLTALSAVTSHPTYLGADRQTRVDIDDLASMLDDLTHPGRDAVLNDFTA